MHHEDLEQKYATEYEQAKLDGKLGFGGKLVQAKPVALACDDYLPEEKDPFEYEGGTKNINVKHYLISF